MTKPCPSCEQTMTLDEEDGVYYCPVCLIEEKVNPYDEQSY